VSALPIENPRRGRQQVDEVGTSLHNLVVDGRRRCKLALATNLSLTQAVQAEDVRSIGMEWLRSVSMLQPPLNTTPEQCIPVGHWSTELDARCRGQPWNPSRSSELQQRVNSQSQERNCSSTTQLWEALTQHVAELILNTALLTEIRRDTEIHDDVGLIGQLLGIQAADEQEANAINEGLGQGLQLAAQGWEREQPL